MKKVIIILLFLALGGGTYYYFGWAQNVRTAPESGYPSPMDNEQIIGGSELTMEEKYTLDEVTIHNNKDDCWLVVEDKIYDVTPFVKGGLHPGKDAILMGCGKDATELFNNRPNGSGTHSERARNMLPNYYKGMLATEE